MWWLWCVLVMAASPEEVALQAALERGSPADVHSAAVSLLSALEAEREGRRAFVRSLELTESSWLAEARDALWLGDAERALQVLQPLRDTPAWTRAAPLWDEAADMLVRQRREEVGRRYLRSRDLVPALRFAELMAVRAQLVLLVQDFPESAYAPALAEDLTRVEREAELVEQRASRSHSG